jgi:hypothetical protein
VAGRSRVTDLHRRKNSRAADGDAVVLAVAVVAAPDPVTLRL